MRPFILLTFFVLLNGCANKYDKYKKPPEYITQASASNAAYFKAYDETLKLWNVSFEELYRIKPNFWVFGYLCK